MQNKANFPKSQMNVNKVLTMDYENKTLGGCGKNKANSKPSQIRPSVDGIKANSKPIYPPKAAKQSQYKPKQSQFVLIWDEIKCIIKDVQIACLVTISFFEKMGRDK